MVSDNSWVVLRCHSLSYFYGEIFYMILLETLFMIELLHFCLILILWHILCYQGQDSLDFALNWIHRKNTFRSFVLIFFGQTLHWYCMVMTGRSLLKDFEASTSSCPAVSCWISDYRRAGAQFCLLWACLESKTRDLNLIIKMTMTCIGSCEIS